MVVAKKGLLCIVLGVSCNPTMDGVQQQVKHLTDHRILCNRIEILHLFLRENSVTQVNG